MPVRGKPMPIVYVTSEAKAYRKTVLDIAIGVGVYHPLPGRVAITVQLYPHRPLDFKARQRKLGAAWDDSVQCIDLDNANKVLLDSLKGVLFEDDAWVRRLSSERMEPDEEGARVVVTVEQLQVERPQLDLLGAAA
jgi:crossover junction endodeoxyribonuclease RusA